MSFRKIDVDVYDEDVLQETELYDPDPREPAQVLSDAKQKQIAVRSALNKLRSLHPQTLLRASVYFPAFVSFSLFVLIPFIPFPSSRGLQ